MQPQVDQMQLKNLITSLLDSSFLQTLGTIIGVRRRKVQTKSKSSVFHDCLLLVNTPNPHSPRWISKDLEGTNVSVS